MYNDIKAVLFDLDGTIYYGSELITNADKVVEKFRAQGKKIFFMTNNSTKSRKNIFKKLEGMGLKCSLEEVYNSGYAAALYAKQNNYNTVYIMGTDDLKNEFQQMQIQLSENADVLVIGYDMDFNYAKLTDALQVAFQANAIIACNKETHYPGENAKRMPGCGAMVGALEGSLGKVVDYVVGKPNTILLEIICKEQNLCSEDVLVIGDTYESDIVMSKEYGCQSIYVGNEVYSDTVCVKTIGEIMDLI